LGAPFSGSTPRGASQARSLESHSAILEVIYQIIDQIAIGKFDIIPFLVAVIVAALLLFLYPNKSALWMRGSNTMAHKA